MPPKCRECLDVGEWTEYRGGAGGVEVICPCPAGRRRRELLEALS